MYICTNFFSFTQKYFSSTCVARVKYLVELNAKRDHEFAWFSICICSLGELKRESTNKDERVHVISLNALARSLYKALMVVDVTLCLVP